jgi:EpsI family protein
VQEGAAVLNRATCLFFPGLLLFLVGAYRTSFPPGEGPRSYLRELPIELLGLPGEDVPVAQAVLDDLESDDLLIRRYNRADGQPVWVVVIYFMNARRGGHDPQLCYRSQGYRVQPLPLLSVPLEGRTFAAEQFLAERTGRKERVALFWHTPRKGETEDVGRYRRDLFWQGLWHNASYGVFVRVSTLDSGDGQAEEWNRRFAAEVASRLPGLIRA